MMRLRDRRAVSREIKEVTGQSLDYRLASQGDIYVKGIPSSVSFSSYITIERDVFFLNTFTHLTLHFNYIIYPSVKFTPLGACFFPTVG